MENFEKMNYLEKWASEVIKRPPLEIKKEIIVEGIQKKHLGPRLEYAIIELKVEPSNCFEVEFSENLKTLDNNTKEFIEEAIYGILDVVLVAKSFPIKNIKINFLSVDIHPVDSNKMAFRNAGRDAGQKIIEKIFNK